MLSINGSNGHGWRCVVCKAIQAKLGHEKHDYDDDVVRTIFAEGAAWGRQQKGILVPDIDHAAKFIASRDAGGDLYVPEFMRRYCAYVTGTRFQDDPPPAPLAIQQVSIRSGRPRIAPSRTPVRQSHAFARA